ncbi:MAG: helix-turn-helix transcriptional regulator [Pseudomonadota bacterium]
MVRKQDETRHEPRTATALDRQIGARIRARRTQIGVSQERLAEIIGVTFQQVQKYERGINRVSASTLFHIARALDMQITALMPKITDDKDLALESALDDPVLRDAIQYFARLNSEGRLLFIELARALTTSHSLKDPRRKSS